MNNTIDIWSRLLIAACVLQTACDDDPGEFDESDLGAIEARSSVNVAPAEDYALAWTSGTKVVVGPDNRLHAVYRHYGYVRYITSADGLVWTAPVVLAGGPTNETTAWRPTIAVAADGTIGVAYRKQQPAEVHYMFKPANGLWSPAFKITADTRSGGGADDPSIVAFGSRMHLTWSKTGSVYYASFPANQSVPLASAERVDHNTAFCSGSTAPSRPAIAVSQRSAADQTERVRIAFFDVYDVDCDEQVFAITVAERGGGGSWQYVKERTFPEPAVAQGWSLSHAAIPSTGDFYVGVSYLEDGVGTTEIWYENAFKNDTWRSVTAFAGKSHVDVSAQFVDCVPTLRYALNSPFDGFVFGETYHRTGRWTGTQAAAPTWSGPPILIDSYGAIPEALFYRKSLGNSIRHVSVLYARVTTGISIAVETTTVPGALVYVPCGSPS